MLFAEPPRTRQLTLGLRNLYIVPTRFGFLWLAAVALLQLVAIQMQSNGTLLLSWLLLALMLLAMHLTHDTLQGLVLHCGEPVPGFAGQPLTYPLRLESSIQRQPLQLRFRAGAPLPVEQLQPGSTTLLLPWQPERRGWHTPPPLRIETTAPLGLFICWSRWQPSQPQLIYPARRPGAVAIEARRRPQEGQDDWHDLRPHRPGDRPALIDWASLARGRRLQVRQFADPAEQEPWLMPAAGLPREQALEHLCDQICRLHQRGACYGLRIGSLRLPPQRGALHRDACLEALALV